MFHRNALAKHCLNNFSLRRDLEMIVVFPEKLYTTKYIISLVINIAPRRVLRRFNQNFIKKTAIKINSEIKTN